MASKKNTVDFETSLAELEHLVESLEKGDLSLEDSLKKFEQGVKLTRACQTALKEAEQKVQLLMEKDGEISPQAFEQDS